MSDNTARNQAIIRHRKRGLEPHAICRRMQLTPGVVMGVLFRAGLTDSDHYKARGRGDDYEPEFKSRVVELALETSQANAARVFKVADRTICGWRRAAAR